MSRSLDQSEFQQATQANYFTRLSSTIPHIWQPPPLARDKAQAAALAFFLDLLRPSGRHQHLNQRTAPHVALSSFVATGFFCSLAALPFAR